MFLSNFEVMLVLSVIIWAAILAIVYVYIIDKLIEERTKAKNYRMKVLTEFEVLIKFMNGETKYTSGETKFVWNSESFDHLIEGKSSVKESVKESNEDIKEKLGEVYRNISKY